MGNYQPIQFLRSPPTTLSPNRLSPTINYTLPTLIKHAPYLRKEKKPQLLRKSTIIRRTIPY